MECQEDPGGKNNLGQSCGDSREEIDSADASATPEEEYCKDEGHPPPQYKDDCHPQMSPQMGATTTDNRVVVPDILVTENNAASLQFSQVEQNTPVDKTDYVILDQPRRCSMDSMVVDVTVDKNDVEHVEQRHGDDNVVILDYTPSGGENMQL